MSGVITFVRHGQTYWNKLGIMHGQQDVPLSPEGVRQAEVLAGELATRKFDVCVCSPLQRAVATANEILKFHRGVDVICDSRLMELCKGTFEGRHANSEELLKKEPLELLMSNGIESKSHFFRRVASALNDICTKYANKNVLVVSHSGTTKMGMFYFSPPDTNIVDAYYSLHINNCDFIDFENKKPNKTPILIDYDIDKERYPLI